MLFTGVKCKRCGGSLYFENGEYRCLSCGRERKRDGSSKAPRRLLIEEETENEKGRWRSRL